MTRVSCCPCCFCYPEMRLVNGRYSRICEKDGIEGVSGVTEEEADKNWEIYNDFVRRNPQLIKPYFFSKTEALVFRSLHGLDKGEL